VNEILDRVHELCEDGRSDDATALYMEIKDWIVQKNDIEVISLEYITSD
jgi:hypothetical protein